MYTEPWMGMRMVGWRIVVMQRRRILRQMVWWRRVERARIVVLRRILRLRMGWWIIRRLVLRMKRISSRRRPRRSWRWIPDRRW